ncbi:MAG: hypothetical protein HYX78_11480 [Armatimonadetes bacterium]|nr:hypothetical protein [Armatimonadota bacterium]
MPEWTVCFDVTVSVSVEASTENEAEEKAETLIAEAWDEDLHMREGVDWTLGKVFAIRDEETCIEILK